MARDYISRTDAEALLAKGWVLEFCSGSTLDSYWAWLREHPSKKGYRAVRRVRLGTANSLRKSLQMVIVQDRPRVAYFEKPNSPDCDTQDRTPAAPLKRRPERRRGWWQVTSINPADPERQRRVHYKRLLENTALRRVERLNKINPAWQAVAEPMPK